MDNHGRLRSGRRLQFPGRSARRLLEAPGR